MFLFEILREDGVVLYHHAETIAELEEKFLLIYQIENESQSFCVHKVDDDLNKIGRKKNYISLENDPVTRAKLMERGDKIFANIFQKLLEDNPEFSSNVIIVDGKK